VHVWHQDRCTFRIKKVLFYEQEAENLKCKHVVLSGLQTILAVWKATMPVSGSAREVRFGTKRFRPLGAFWNQAVPPARCVLEPRRRCILWSRGALGVRSVASVVQAEFWVREVSSSGFFKTVNARQSCITSV
jgi:hypothetical protein